MGDLIVGDKPCTFNALVVTIFENEEDLEDDIPKIATRVGLSPIDQKAILRMIKPPNNDLEGGMSKLLQKWRSQESKKATLKKFIAVLKAIKLHEIAERLEEKFGVTEEKSTPPELPQPSGSSTQGEDEIDFSNLTTPPLEQDGGCSGKIKKTRPEYPHLWEINGNNLIQGIVGRPFPDIADDEYRLSANGKRKALLINIIQFISEENNRAGALYDSYNLHNLLTQLNFDITSYCDIKVPFTATILDKIICRFKKECISEKVESFVVFVGSHGKHGKILLSDDTEVNLHKEIIYKMAKKPEDELGDYWRNIPKVFLVSACRIEVDAVRPYDNTIVCYSCLPNEESSRDPLSGTLYIKAFTDIMLNECDRKDFKTIISMVEKQVWKNTGGEQQPNYEGMGTFRKLYFNV